MGLRGPKPQPNSLKLLKGNPGKRPLPPEPKATGTPSPTEKLTGRAQRFWDRVVPQLVQMGVAKSIDSDVLTVMCQWWQRYQELSQRDDMEPRLQTAAMANAWRCCMDIARRFGMSPSDRVGLIVDANEEPDEFENFLAAREKQG